MRHRFRVTSILAPLLLALLSTCTGSTTPPAWPSDQPYDRIDGDHQREYFLQQVQQVERADAGGWYVSFRCSRATS